MDAGKFSLAALFFVIMIVGVVYAQAPDTLWTRTYGGPGDEQAYDVIETSDGGYLIVGYTMSYGALEKDIYLVKTDQNGDVIWTRTFDSGFEWANEWAESVVEAEDGGFVFTGVYTGDFLSKDVLLMKVDSNGDSLWARLFGEGNSDYGHCVRSTDDGGYIIVGSNGHSDHYGEWSYAYLIKTNAIGEQQWVREYPHGDPGYCVQQTFDGGYIISSQSNLTYSRLLLLKTDYTGEIQWERLYNGSQHTRGYCVLQTPDSGYVVSGHRWPAVGGIYLAKFNNVGDRLWYLSLGNAGIDYGYKSKILPDGGFILAGVITTESDNKDVYIVRTDCNGDTIWTVSFGGEYEEVGRGIDVTSDGNYIVAGHTLSYGSGGMDMYVLKITGQSTLIELSSDSLVFGHQYNGESAMLPLTISNSSNSQLIFRNIYSSSPAFTCTYQSADSLLAVGDSLMLNVTFTPLESIEYKGRLIIQGDTFGSWIRLTGSGLSRLEVSSNELDFGGKEVGTRKVLPLVIYNISNTPLIIYSIYPSDSNFSSDFTLEDSLISPGDSLNVVVIFAPMVSGMYDEVLNVRNSDMDESIALTATSYMGKSSYPPEEFALFGSYPNPFNSSTVIRYDIPVLSEVKINVFNILGKSEGTIWENYVDVGRHSVVWDAGDLSSGVYFVRMSVRTPSGKAGEFMQTRKVVLRK